MAKSIFAGIEIRGKWVQNMSIDKIYDIYTNLLEKCEMDEKKNEKDYFLYIDLLPKIESQDDFASPSQGPYENRKMRNMSSLRSLSTDFDEK